MFFSYPNFVNGIPLKSEKLILNNYYPDKRYHPPAKFEHDFTRGKTKQKLLNEKPIPAASSNDNIVLNKPPGPIVYDFATTSYAMDVLENPKPVASSDFSDFGPSKVKYNYG